MKCKEATENPNQYFSNVKFVNFVIIYNDIRKTKLQKPLEEYQTINKNDFDGYDQKLKNEMLVQLIDPNVRMFFFLRKT